MFDLTALINARPEPVQAPSAEEVTLRALLTPDEVFDAVREVFDDEDVGEGLAPVQEDVVARTATAPLPEDKPSVIELPAYSAEDKARLVSKVPAEALHVIFSALYPNGWWREEVEVLSEDLLGMGLKLDAGGFSKMRALHAILASPADRSAFHNYPGSFAFMCSSLSGRPVRIDGPGFTPTPVEMAIAMHVVATVRPERYGDSVLGYIAATCLAQYLWALPDQLQLAQSATYRILDYWNMPIGESDVARVKDLVDGGLPPIPDQLGTENMWLLQARLYQEVHERVDTQLDFGEDVASNLREEFERRAKRT